MKLKNIFVVAFAALLLTVSVTDICAQNKKRIGGQAAKKTSVIQKSSLLFEAGLVFNSGDAKPVARTEFYLLDKDLQAIMIDEGIQPKTTESATSNSNTLSAQLDQLNAVNAMGDGFGMNAIQSYAIWSRSPHLYEENFLKTQAAIKPHIIFTTTTDFNGKGTFSGVKTGKYYLMGVTKVGKQAVVWNLPIEIKTGTQTVILDQKNAAEIF